MRPTGRRPSAGEGLRRRPHEPGDVVRVGDHHEVTRGHLDGRRAHPRGEPALRLGRDRLVGSGAEGSAASGGGDGARSGLAGTPYSCLPGAAHSRLVGTPYLPSRSAVDGVPFPSPWALGLLTAGLAVAAALDRSSPEVMLTRTFPAGFSASRGRTITTRGAPG